MIIEGNQRGGARNLSRHLVAEENDHVEVYDLRGYVADDLEGALDESYAASLGTRAKKYLFSVSFNPPPEVNVSTEKFEDAIDRVEKEFGLDKQQRAVVFHEKHGRRHCHAVWSRIDCDQMKAIPLSHTKLRLVDISRDLYIEHNWKMPKGFIRGHGPDPNNFTLSEWQQAKQVGKDPKMVKQTIRDCWAASDAQASFAHALEEHGLKLASGRRGVVAIDQACEVHAVSRAIGLRAKEVGSKVKDESLLLDVEQAKTLVANELAKKLSELQKHRGAKVRTRRSKIEHEQKIFKAQQHYERQMLR